MSRKLRASHSSCVAARFVITGVVHKIFNPVALKIVDKVPEGLHIIFNETPKIRCATQITKNFLFLFHFDPSPSRIIKVPGFLTHVPYTISSHPIDGTNPLRVHPA